MLRVLTRCSGCVRHLRRLLHGPLNCKGTNCQNHAEQNCDGETLHEIYSPFETVRPVCPEMPVAFGGRVENRELMNEPGPERLPERVPADVLLGMVLEIPP